ncbi:hypothetical protein EVAR_5807_1 [Eumeta japonica]|uniref:Uncharacterized protein n=1 Tax=Eumeta variegata TaxID=151549 RepID=A0A4C1T4D1_EUMVA|nr:hypothetical protein EVAR_5807_1 [Eumeta japonica]
MHLKLCDFLHKDKFLGVALRQGKFAKPCPYPADVYDLYNMTVNSPSISKSFPFRKGRMYGNISLVDELVITGYFDMDIRESRGTNKKG